MNTFADCAVRCALALKLAEEEDAKVVHMSPERERARETRGILYSAFPTLYASSDAQIHFHGNHGDAYIYVC